MPKRYGRVGGRAAALWLSAFDGIAEARRRRGVARPGASDHERVAVASAEAETKAVSVLETNSDRDYYAAESTSGMDFVSDSLADGRSFRALEIVDQYTRECPAIELDLSLPGAHVSPVEQLADERELPDAIRVDRGPEIRLRRGAQMV